MVPQDREPGMADPAAPVHLHQAPSFSWSLRLSLSSPGQWARGGAPHEVGAGCCPPNLRDSERGERKCCGQEGTGVVAESAKPALSAPGAPELAPAGPRHTQPRAPWPEPRAVWLADPSLRGADRWRSRTHTALAGQTRIPPQRPHFPGLGFSEPQFPQLSNGAWQEMRRCQGYRSF